MSVWLLTRFNGLSITNRSRYMETCIKSLRARTDLLINSITNQNLGQSDLVYWIYVYLTLLI